MTSATSAGKKVGTMKRRIKQAEDKELSDAASAIYAKYGNRLDLYMADVQAELNRQSPAP